MTTITSTFHQVVCDWPGCQAVDDGGEYGWWDDQHYAFEQAREGEWAVEEEPRWRQLSPVGQYPVVYAEEPLSFCPEHKREHGYWLADGPGDGYPGGSDPSPIAEDAYVVRLPSGELVPCL